MSTYTSPPGQSDIVAHIVAKGFDIETILDIGIGNGFALKAFHAAGMKVTGTGFDLDRYLADRASLPPDARLLENVDVCDMSVFDDASFDAVWCSHVLEHVGNVDKALAEIKRVIKPKGYLFLCVPPFKYEIVGGHVSTGWSAGMMMYRLALAGFDLAEASFVRHGYNIAGIVRNGAPIPAEHRLAMANGDIEALRDMGRFPKGFDAHQGFDGNIANWNWEWACTPQLAVSTSTPSTSTPTGPSVARTPPSRRARATKKANNLRIGLFIPWITQGRGGTERIGTMVANALAERGHRVFIHTHDDARNPASWPLHETIELRHHPESDTPESEIQTIMELVAQNLDVLVGLHMNRQFYRYVYYAHRTGVPVVLSEHIDPAFPRDLGRFGEAEREAIFSAADRIHLIIEEFRDTLPDYLQDRITVIPNSVEPAKHLANTRAGEHDCTLLTVARLVSRKNIDTLIRAFHLAQAEVPGWRLQIAGYGGEQEKLEKLSRGLGITNRVQFLGKVEEPYSLYEQAQLFCLPSYTEAFGLTALEAMAHGLPVVVFADCPGLNMLVRDQITGIHASRKDQVQSLAQALIELMADADKRERMGRCALERYDEFRMEHVIPRWEKMLRDVVERAAGRSRAALDYPREAIMQMSLLQRFGHGLDTYFESPLFADGEKPPASTSWHRKPKKLPA